MGEFPSLEQLSKDHFSSREQAAARYTALDERERAEQDYRDAGGYPALDKLWDEHQESRKGYIFAPYPPEAPARGQEVVDDYLPPAEEMPLDDPQRPFTSEEVPDIAKRLHRPAERRRPELLTPTELRELHPTWGSESVELNTYLNANGIPIPAEGSMPSREEALRIQTTMQGIYKRQHLWLNTDVKPEAVSSIPRNQRWFAAWMWQQMVLKEKEQKEKKRTEFRPSMRPGLRRPTKEEIEEDRKAFAPGEQRGHAERLGRTFWVAAGDMKDAFHDVGVHYLALRDTSISNPDREFALELDKIRGSADVYGIRPFSAQEERKTIIDLIKEGRGRDIFERGGYGAAAMGPDVLATMATAGASKYVAGGVWGARILTGGSTATAYWWARSVPDLRRDLLEMGFDDEEATYVAAITAVPYAAIEQLQIKQFTAPLKNFARDNVEATVRQMLVRQGKDGLKLWAVEWGEEGLQGGVELINIALAKALSEKDPSVPWLKLLNEKQKELQEAAVVIPFLIGPRASAQAIQDFSANPSRIKYSELPPPLQKLLGDPFNPDDPASKQANRDKYAGRLQEMQQDILTGFAHAVSEEEAERNVAKDLFEGPPPSAEDVDVALTPEQRISMFDTVNPTDEQIQKIWKRKRDHLRRRAKAEEDRDALPATREEAEALHQERFPEEVAAEPAVAPEPVQPTRQPRVYWNEKLWQEIVSLREKARTVRGRKRRRAQTKLKLKLRQMQEEEAAHTGVELDPAGTDAKRKERAAIEREMMVPSRYLETALEVPLPADMTEESQSESRRDLEAMSLDEVASVIGSLAAEMAAAERAGETIDPRMMVLANQAASIATAKSQDIGAEEENRLNEIVQKAYGARTAELPVVRSRQPGIEPEPGAVPVEETAPGVPSLKTTAELTAKLESLDEDLRVRFASGVDAVAAFMEEYKIDEAKVADLSFAALIGRLIDIADSGSEQKAALERALSSFREAGLVSTRVGLFAELLDEAEAAEEETPRERAQRRQREREGEPQQFGDMDVGEDEVLIRPPAEKSEIGEALSHLTTITTQLTLLKAQRQKASDEGDDVEAQALFEAIKAKQVQRIAAQNTLSAAREAAGEELTAVEQRQAERKRFGEMGLDELAIELGRLQREAGDKPYTGPAAEAFKKRTSELEDSTQTYLDNLRSNVMVGMEVEGAKAKARRVAAEAFPDAAEEPAAEPPVTVPPAEEPAAEVQKPDHIDDFVFSEETNDRTYTDPESGYSWTVKGGMENVYINEKGEFLSTTPKNLDAFYKRGGSQALKGFSRLIEVSPTGVETDLGKYGASDLMFPDSEIIAIVRDRIRQEKAPPAAEPAPPKKGTKADTRDNRSAKRRAERKEEIDKLGKEINDDLEGLFGELNDTLFDVTQMLDPKLMKKVAAIGVKMVRLGRYRFEQFVDAILGKFAEQYGVEKAELLSVQLPSIWGMVLGHDELEEKHQDEVEVLRPKAYKAIAQASMATIREDYSGTAAQTPDPDDDLRPQDMGKDEWVARGVSLGQDEEGLKTEHREAVEAAVTAGDPVHEDALADYPDLAIGVDRVPEDRAGLEAAIKQVEAEIQQVQQQIKDADPNVDMSQQVAEVAALMGRQAELYTALAAVAQKEVDQNETVGTGPVGVDDRGDLEEPEPTVGEDVGEGGEAVPDAEGQAGEGGADVRDAGDEGVAAPAGEGLGDVGVDPAAGADAASQQPDRPGSPGTNHRIKDEDEIGIGNDRKKAEDNLEAIELVKRLEREVRKPSNEEKRVLARYVGWGGLSKVFDKYTPSNDHREWGDKLRTLLPENSDEYKAAMKSTKNAHYTSTQIVKAMWDAVRSFGFSGGKVLEPGMGVGHFFGLMPGDLAKNSELVGVELDTITGKIAAYLYENATIHQKGYQSLVVPDGHFDLVIGNVPFGTERIVDDLDKRLRKTGEGGELKQKMLIHNFFLSKSVLKTRPGGLIVTLSSTGTLDSNKDGHISFMKKHGAELVGSVRLPGIAFKENARTEVTTDLLVFQRQLENQPLGGQDWGGKPELFDTHETPGTTVEASRYFKDNRQHLLGRVIASEMYGEATNRMALIKFFDDSTMEDYKPRIKEALDELAKRVDYKAHDQTTARTEELDEAGTQEAPVNEDWQAITDYLLEGNQHVAEIGGKLTLWQKQDGVLVEQEYNPVNRDEKLLRLRRINEIRDTARDLRNAEKDPDASDERVEARRRLLNIQYDRYIRKHEKVLNNRRAMPLIAKDSSAPSIYALEVPIKDKAGNVTIVKADIFDHRLVWPTPPILSANTPQDALAASMAERGTIDWKWMSEISGIEIDDLQLALEDMLFRNPTGGWETGDIYLGGNVRTKLAAAVRAAETDSRYERNVAALLEVQPRDWSPAEINPLVGESWIPADVYDEFARELVGSRQGYYYIEADGQWHARENRAPAVIKKKAASFYGGELANKALTEYGTYEIPFDTLMLTIMNGKIIIVNYPKKDGGGLNVEATEQAKSAANAIQDKFSLWLWEDDDRAVMLHRRYNDLQNNWAKPVYDGSHLRFPGMSEEWKANLRNPDYSFQSDNIWRMIVGGNTLLAHAVGFGKTVQMIAAAMEMRRLGIKKRPMFVVPNHLFAQWAQAIAEIYPSAKVLAPSSEELGSGQKAIRQTVLERINTGDWDIILMTPQVFDLMPMTEEYVTAFFNDEMDALRASMMEVQREGGSQKVARQTVKQMQTALDSLESQMQSMLDRMTKLPGPYFDELGIDALFVDEAQDYKNLYAKTRMGNVPGIQNKPVAGPFDMYQKTTYLNEQTNGRGVYFATATPVTNTMGELHVMMRYLDPGLLEERGISTFDQWAKRFGVVETKLEVEAVGQGLRENTRFSKFRQVPALKQIWDQFVDTKLRSDLDLPLPRVKKLAQEQFRSLADKKGWVRREILGEFWMPPDTGAIEIVAPISDMQQDAVDSLVERIRAIRGGGVDPKLDNMFMILNDGRKVATDMRLLDPSLPDDPNSKTNQMVTNVLDVYKRTTDMEFSDGSVGGGVQVLWVDRGVPGTEGFDLYQDIKDKLILNGVPEHEIAFIQETTKGSRKKIAEAKNELFRQLNAGEKRIVIASTQAMATGANIQERLYAAHHLDAPYRPSDIEQRDGRPIRPGNLNDMVEIYRYVTEKTFDTFMWATLARKWGFLMDFYKSDSTVQEVEEVDEILDPDQMLALATGDPKISRMIKLDAEVQQLAREKVGFDRSVWVNRSDLAKTKSELKDSIQKTKEHEFLAEYFAEKRAVVAEKSDGKRDFEVMIRGETYHAPGKAGEAVLAYIKENLKTKDPSLVLDVGSIYGMPLRYTKATGEVWGRIAGMPQVKFHGKMNPKNPNTAFKAIFSEIKKQESKAELQREKSGEMSKRIATLERAKNRVWSKAREFEEKTTELAQLKEDILRGTDEAPEVNTAEGSQGEGKKQEMRESALLQQQQRQQAQQDMWDRERGLGGGGPASPMSPFQNVPFNNYMALLPIPSGVGPKPRGSELQPTVNPSDPLTIPEQLQVPDREVEGRLQGAHGVPRERLIQKITGAISYIWRGVTRVNTELSMPTVWRLGKQARATAREEQEFLGPIHEYFRLLKNAPNAGNHHALRVIDTIVGELDREHFWVFERYVLTLSALRTMDLAQPRNYSWKSRKQIEDYKKILDDFIDGTDITYKTRDGRIVKSDGMPNIRRAIAGRNAIIKEIVNNQIDLGLLPPEVADAPEDYFHHHIIALQQSADFAKGARTPKPVKRAYQKRKLTVEEVGEVMPPLVMEDGTEVFLDPNSNYLEAELTWMTEAFIEAYKKKILNDLDAHCGQKAPLKKEAKRLNYLNVVGGEANLTRIRTLERNVRESLDEEDADDPVELARRKV